MNELIEKINASFETLKADAELQAGKETKRQVQEHARLLLNWKNF